MAETNDGSGRFPAHVIKDCDDWDHEDTDDSTYRVDYVNEFDEPSPFMWRDLFELNIALREASRVYQDPAIYSAIEKIEQVSYCDLTEDQRAAYQQILEASRREVLESVETQGAQKSRVVLLNALLRLRQICCDLRLLKLEGVDPGKASGKLDLFSELLEEVLEVPHICVG